MNAYEFADEELEPIDYLKELKRNADSMAHLREEKLGLVEKAVDAGYGNSAISRAIGQSEAGVRMYRIRNNLK